MGVSIIPRLLFLYKDELPHRAIALYMYLYDRADGNGCCYPSVRTIAKDLKLSVSTVKRAITDLSRAGYLTTEQRYRKNGAKSSLFFHVIRP